jgi:hypothetical protein
MPPPDRRQQREPGEEDRTKRARRRSDGDHAVAEMTLDSLMPLRTAHA